MSPYNPPAPPLATMRQVLGCADLDLQIFSYSDLEKAKPVLRQGLKDAVADQPEAPQSLTHAIHFGGFAYSRLAGVGVGIDIEDPLRIKDDITRRISSQLEFSEAPKKFFLWAAKESAWKSCRTFQQPRIISEIQIVQWQQIETHLWKFKFSGENGRGVIWEQSRFILGISIWHSTLVRPLR